MSSFAWDNSQSETTTTTAASGDGKVKPEELVVYGCGCKIFKDEKIARFLDQGKHLIPWMGSESLLIDRFDVRGYLQHLNLYEAKNGITNKDATEGLTEQELQIEKLCDQERYADFKLQSGDEDGHENAGAKRKAASTSTTSVTTNSSTTAGSKTSSKSKKKAAQTERNFKKQRFHCHICPQGFTAKRNLQRHMQIHSCYRKKFECDICSKVFSWKHTLNTHKEKAHNVNV